MILSEGGYGELLFLALGGIGPPIFRSDFEKLLETEAQ